MGTTTILLTRLAEKPYDEATWEAFALRYGSVICARCKRKLQDADAEDLTQEVLIKIADAAAKGKYRPGKGHTRAWVETIIRNAQVDFFRRRRVDGRQPGTGGGAEVLELIPSEELAQVWEREERQEMLEVAKNRVLERLDPRARDVVLATLADGVLGKDVAKSFTTSPATVSRIRRQVFALIRVEFEQLANGQGNALEGSHEQSA